MESVNCNICGSHRQDLITEDENYDHSLKLVLCKDCGLGYLSPRWTEDEYQRFYERSYDTKYRANIKKKRELVENRDFPLITRLNSYGFLNGNIKNVLDIGCGAGDILMKLTKNLPEVNLFGIEPSLNAQSILADRKIQLISTNVNSEWDENNNEKFDLIIMRHVLEHFLDPKSVLRKVRNTLSDNGVIYIAVPNNLKPIHNLRRKWFRVVHTYYFNKYTLSNLVTSSGYEVLKMGEEDELSKGEVYVIVRKTNELNQTTISPEHYEMQKTVFEERAKFDNLLTNRVKDWRRAILAKLISKRN